MFLFKYLLSFLDVAEMKLMTNLVLASLVMESHHKRFAFEMSTLKFDCVHHFLSMPIKEWNTKRDSCRQRRRADFSC